MDARTGEVLRSRNADTRLHPASLTKMMTLYVTFEAVEHGEISLDTKVRVSKAAAAEPASKLYLKAGSSIELRYLIRAAAVKSANDAAHVIAEAVGGSVPGFAARMNRTAKALGMNNTTFKNPHGLTTPGHLSTARDMSNLGRHLFYDYPEYYNLFSRITTDAKVTTVANTNRRLLSSYRGADGIKTGYTNAAGSNLVASAERGGVRIIATVMGGSSAAARNKRVAELLDLGFSRAPKYAKLDRPHKPNYASIVAVASNGSRGGTMLKTSAVPKARPGYVVALAAAQSNIVIAEADINDALKEAQATVAVTEATSLPEEVVARSFVPLPRPEDLAPAPAAPVPAGDPATQLARAALDETEVKKEAEKLAATAPAPEASEETVELAMAETATDAPAPVAAAETAALKIEIPRSPVPVHAPAEAMVETAALELPAGMERPEPRPAVTFSTSDMTLEDQASAQPVTVSTVDGPEGWSVSVGRYSSRWQAERALLRTALQQVDLLANAKRAVVSKPTGYEVQFVGLSEADAQQTCQRLTARDERCSAHGS
ncbi:serine hydrolase [Poseidonocella sp. HB161398]|uniref:serine hydrolase n=1 Tax=Poseidonocella sp. HB161398 TaxID=2320855 RepID=UPI001F0EDAC4